MKQALYAVALLGAALLTSAPVSAAVPNSGSVFIEELTSTELRDKLAAGADTVLVPIGGTEQNGPHMVLGKHNVRVKYLAGQIAQDLGNAVVAPVLAYVPEGSITPPVAHMRFTGTLSIPEATFEALLVATAKSFKQHGFHHIFFLGDHGGYQKKEANAAAALNKAWAAEPNFRAFALTDYYAFAQEPVNSVLRSKGYSKAEIGVHAGLADTSLAMAVDASLVRTDKLAQAAAGSPANGVVGDPRRSAAELGQAGLQTIVELSVKAIRHAVKTHPVH